MTDLVMAKACVRAMYAALEQGKSLHHFVAPDYLWRGMHPFHTQHGAEAVEATFWRPFFDAFGPVQRRTDMFIAGENSIAPGTWVVEMGHLLGLFDAPWLGIQPTRKMTYLRFAEFHKIEDGLIVETASYIDILGVLQQAGQNPLPRQTGASIVTPGPSTHDGVISTPADLTEGQKTLALIEAMIVDLTAGRLNSPLPHLEKFWTPDMCWFGPAGIGASSGYEGYRRGHCQPFEEGLTYLRHNGHQCRLAEGNFGGFFGYPSMTVKNTGGYLGVTANDIEADMRIVDLYRRDGDRLAENWVFIDLLHWLNQQGLDVLARLPKPR